MNHGFRSILLLLLMTGWASGQEGGLDGKQQYELYCGACHGVDGKGATGGQFPPLADSNWVKGSPSRMLQVVLHGLQGAITVKSEGKYTPYNLVMPPQGMALRDDQIAAIATYVRSAWGNKEGPVTPKMVKAEREATAGRAKMWGGNEILRTYPLPGQKKKPQPLGKIENLIALVYKGKFKSLSEMKATEPVTAEEEKGGIVTLKHASPHKDHFGVVWSGEVVAPVEGEYHFELDSDDGSAVFLNDKQVAAVKGIGSMGRTAKGKIALTKGRHKIRVEFFEFSGNEGITLRWKGPRSAWTALSDTKIKKEVPPPPMIPVAPSNGNAVIYRNFIEGTTARGIGVGYDRGLNISFSADHMAMELIWSGDFISGGLHWTGRGKGRTKPLGNPIKLTSGPAFAILADEKAAWPKEYGEALTPKFNGYELKEKKHAMFFYHLGELKVTDFPEPKGGEKIPGLARRIWIEAGEGAPQKLYFRVANGLPVKEVGSRSFQIGERLFVQVAGNASGQPVIRGKELLLPVTLKTGVNKILLNYTLD